jgi:competence protein ComEC
LDSGPVPLELAAVAAGIAGATLAWLGAPAVGVGCAALAVAGASVGAARVEAIDAPREAIARGVYVDGLAILHEAPRTSGFGSSAEVEIVGGPGGGAHLIARASGDVEWPDGLGIGDEILVTGRAGPAASDPAADFDWPAHLSRMGVAGELELERVEATGKSRGGLAGAVDAIRDGAEQALDAGVTEPQSALVRGMVLGQDERIDDLVRDDFRSAGLGHLLAVSGQNVLLLAVLALPLLAALGLGPRARLLSVMGLIAVYVPLAGAGPSLQRAGAVGMASFAALALGRAPSRWYALLLAAGATLALNPRVSGDAGWQLSFAAVIGILSLGPGIRRALGGLPRILADGVSLSVSATLSTAPLLMHHFGQASVASLPANLLALPAVAPVMWIGMVQIGLGQALAAPGPLASASHAAVTALGAVNATLLDYLAWLARRFAELPWAEVGFELGSPVEVGAAYGLLAAIALAARPVSRRAGPSATAMAGRWRTSSHGTRVALLVATAVGGLALTAEATDPDTPDHLTVSFLEVGQGDATLVQHPAGGAILIDGGPAEARAYRLVQEAGVDRLGLVVATHAAADHHGGLREVLEHVQVDLLLDGGDGTSDPEFRAMLAEAEDQGVRRIPAVAGQELQIGELTVEVLWPEPRSGPPPEDPNLRAVTTLVTADDFELMASGDAESPSLASLDLPDVDVLKVPHHGSEDEGLPQLLTELRPEVAAIGVGEDNGYGHPTPSTLDALEDSGAGVYRTDLDGTIEATVVDGGIEVTTER